jgi:hypothetical protein
LPPPMNAICVINFFLLAGLFEAYLNTGLA